MIDIYFVRHGETDGNVAHRMQTDLSRLTSRGRKQALQVGKELAAYKPTHLITSTHVRAVETTTLIEQSISLIPETSELFRELLRPRHVTGYYLKSFTAFRYFFWWYFGTAGGAGIEEDGESYSTFRRRLKDARLHLTALPDQSRVVVVSHSVFITMFMAHMCHEDKLPPLRAFFTLLKIFLYKNTGIVHVRFAPEHVNTECPWRCPKVR